MRRLGLSGGLAVALTGLALMSGCGDDAPGAATAGTPAASSASGPGQACEQLLSGYANAFGSADRSHATAENFQRLADEYSQISVPDDLQDDMSVFIDGIQRNANLLTKFDNDVQKIIADADAQAEFSEINTGRFAQASTAILRYVQESCGTGS